MLKNQKVVSFQVGDLVVPLDYPPHWESWFPFKIISIFDGFAQTDITEKPIALDNLKLYERD